MEFLKTVFGDRPLTFDEFVQAINAHNGNEANAQNMIKLANLAGGEYVGKGKYDALEASLTGKQSELDAANGMIADLRKNAKTSEEMQARFTAYDQQVQQLQAQLAEAKINGALKVALLAENCSDVDYVTYKLQANLREEGKNLELDENENIKGWNDLISGLKTQLPNQFTSGAGNRKVLGDNRLPTSDDRPVTVTKEQFAGMGYNERMKLKTENEQLFKKLASNT